MSTISTRICVPNLVAVRRSCRKKGEGYRQTDRQTDKGNLQLYIVDNLNLGHYDHPLVTVFVNFKNRIESKHC